jgi:dTDP-glucose pyrophosphorylase
MHPNVNFSCHYQREAGGIAQALALTEPFVGDSNLAVVLGDNVFEDDVSEEDDEDYEEAGGDMNLYDSRLDDLDELNFMKETMMGLMAN